MMFVIYKYHWGYEIISNLANFLLSIKEASAIWSVPVIDTYSLSGLMPSRPEHEIYVPGGNDNLHPNTEGHRRLALCVYYQLMALPCVF